MCRGIKVSIFKKKALPVIHTLNLIRRPGYFYSYVNLNTIFLKYDFMRTCQAWLRTSNPFLRSVAAVNGSEYGEV